jgi:hypothetical protein
VGGAGNGVGVSTGLEATTHSELCSMAAAGAVTDGVTVGD